MINLDSNINEKCLVCFHYGFCQLYWGTECKRQGGTRIPRLKNGRSIKKNASSRQKPTKMERCKLKTFEVIRTRRENWGY